MKYFKCKVEMSKWRWRLSARFENVFILHWNKYWFSLCF